MYIVRRVCLLLSAWIQHSEPSTEWNDSVWHGTINQKALLWEIKLSNSRKDDILIHCAIAACHLPLEKKHL